MKSRAELVGTRGATLESMMEKIIAKEWIDGGQRLAELVELRAGGARLV